MYLSCTFAYESMLTRKTAVLNAEFHDRLNSIHVVFRRELLNIEGEDDFMNMGK